MCVWSSCASIRDGPALTKPNTAISEYTIDIGNLLIFIQPPMAFVEIDGHKSDGRGAYSERRSSLCPLTSKQAPNLRICFRKRGYVGEFAKKIRRGKSHARICEKVIPWTSDAEILSLSGRRSL